jgi:hypothetical protein
MKRVRHGFSRFWPFLGVLLVGFKKKPSKSTTRLTFRGFFDVVLVG